MSGGGFMPKFDSKPWLQTLYGMLMILIFWYVMHFAVSSPAIPAPHKALLRFIQIFPGTLSLHLGVSFLRILSALAISLLTGVALGLWMGVGEAADRWLSPVVYLLYPLPKIAFLPVLMILFGLGESSKIVLIVLIIVFQIVVATRDGVREIPRELFYSVLSLGLGKRAMYRHLILPATLPKIITAVRISVGVSISVLFFGENYATTYGIGYFIMNSWIMADYVEMFSGILALSLMGLVMFKIIDLFEARFCRWSRLGKSSLNMDESRW
jgi:NitT/TauT family transport system permease protein